MWLVLMLVSCADKPTVVEAESVLSLPVPENGYQLVTPDYVVPPFSEREICTVMRLEPNGDERLYWANTLESLVTEGTHHMNVMMGEFSFLDAFIGDGASENALGAVAGQYPCEELSTMELAYTIFPSQRDSQKITLPEGVAAPLTAPLWLVFSHHYVNPTEDSITISAILNIETIPASEVTDVAGLVFSGVPDLEVPVGAERVIGRTCVFDRDVQVALVSSHTHEWGECVTMNQYAADSSTIEPEPFFVNKRWEQPPILHFEPGVFSVAAGDGIHWACHYQNDTEYTLVEDGTAEGEMCVFAAVTYPSPWTVEQVEETVSGEDLVGLMGLLGDVMGPCDAVIDTVASPWPEDKSDACEEFEQTESNTLE